VLSVVGGGGDLDLLLIILQWGRVVVADYFKVHLFHYLKWRTL
jgi:hypothetical protein